jgi:rod shape determining protein RodA
MNTTPIHSVEEQVRARASAPSWLRIDPWLFLAPVGLLLCSFITLHGASGSAYSSRQAVYGGAGILLALLFTRFDYSRLREYRIGFYVILILTNLAVFGFHGTNGATRWIPLPFFQFQPSEFGKLLLILTVASVGVEATRRGSSRRTTARIMLLALIPAMIVIKQPDLGTGLVYVTVAGAVLFFSGTSWKQLAALAALFAIAVTLVLAVGPAVGVNVLKGYQKQRLTTFIDPPTACTEKDPTCYQLNEGLIAIGSGGKTGQGVAGATQASYGFIPEYQNDFIFAVVGETYGFAGAAVVLSLYALLIWRAIRIMTMAKNLFGTLVAGGILAMLMFQIFLNVGMTIGIMPVTGVPLPLLSYGGSSVIVTFLAIGLLQSIHIQARLASGAKARVLLV